MFFLIELKEKIFLNIGWQGLNLWVMQARLFWKCIIKLVLILDEVMRIGLGSVLRVVMACLCSCFFFIVFFIKIWIGQFCIDVIDIWQLFFLFSILCCLKLIFSVLFMFIVFLILQFIIVLFFRKSWVFVLFVKLCIRLILRSQFLVVLQLAWLQCFFLGFVFWFRNFWQARFMLVFNVSI